MLDTLRRRIVGAATGLFAHADDPLADTLTYRGDPGLFGPDSVTWRVMGDPATFVGGIRALLIQAAHPEVVAGVDDHSRYRDDPLGRLSRTSNYVTATAYGAEPEVAAAIAQVRRAHRPVRGTSHRGNPYTADAPALAAWVHNSLTESFLVSNQRFGTSPLTPEQADRFVAEQAIVGRRMGASPVPTTANELTAWLAGHPEIGPSPGMEAAVDFLRRPPLTVGVRLGYHLLAAAAVSTIPVRIQSILGVRSGWMGAQAGRIMVRCLQWALGASPRWRMALLRVGIDPPAGMFKQRVPFEDVR